MYLEFTRFHRKVLNFMKERLGEGGKSIFEPISKSNIQISNENKKSRKTYLVLKEDKKVFRIIRANPTDFHEPISYSITSSLARLALKIML